MAVITTGQMNAEIDTQYPDNHLNLVTPAIHRSVMHDVISYTSTYSGEVINAQAAPFGAAGDGITNDTSALTSCYNYCAANGFTMFVPTGTYLVDGLSWSPTNNVRGAGSSQTIFIPSRNNITIINIVGGPTFGTRDQIREIGHFSVDGGSKTGIIGVHFDFINYSHMRDIACMNCDTGAHIEGGNFCIYDKLTGTGNNFAGLRLTDDLSGVTGGGNSMQFNNCDFSNNQVGMMAGRPGMPFPMGSNIFLNAIIQSNTLCAVYCFESSMAFHNFAPEGNGSGGAGSAVVYGQTVTKSSLQVIGAEILFTCYTDDSPTVPVLAQSGALLSFITSTTPNNLVADSTSVVDIQGTNNTGASVTNALLDISDQGNANQIGANNFANMIVDQSFPNNFPVPTNAPTPTDFNCASVGFDTDPSLGLVTTATFNAVAGSGTSNRVRYVSSDNPLPINGNIYISFLINPNITGTFGVQDAQSLITYDPITLTGGVWTRIFAKNFNTTGLSLSTNLTIYPDDNHGATIKLCRFVTLINPTAFQGRLLSRDHRYNPRDKQGFRNLQSSIPTVGTWVVGDIVWNSAPAAGGFIGWVCTTGGTPGTWKTWGAISP